MTPKLNPNNAKDKRRSRWASSLASLQHLNSAYRDPETRTRKTDLITNLYLATALILATFCILFPQARTNFFWFSNLFIGITIIFYIANRFGVISSVAHRQAIIFWELLLACLVLGIYIATNFMLFGAWFRSLISQT